MLSVYSTSNLEPELKVNMENLVNVYQNDPDDVREGWGRCFALGFLV
jgi:hypothetical protein